MEPPEPHVARKAQKVKRINPILFKNSTRYIAQSVLGTDDDRAMAHVQAWASGRIKLTVEQLHEIIELMPGLDVRRSLKDLYERYSVFSYRSTARGANRDLRVGRDARPFGVDEHEPVPDGQEEGEDS
jgi:hypothetical protein